MMFIDKAKEFIRAEARPLELALYEYFYENGSKQSVIDELRKYQNADGGFGHGLEADNWNPKSTPIATNDALITLFRIGALDAESDMVRGMVKYLSSHDSFDEDKKRWLFAIESSKNYPHAIWWEKDGDGINGYNPTVSLAAFLVCFAGRSEYYENIIRSAFEYLPDADKFSGDDMKCFLLCCELLRQNGITDVVDLPEAKLLLCEKLAATICPDTSKYGVEYITVPSDFLVWDFYDGFMTDEVRKLVETEKAVLGKIQKEDGGFDITWQWYTDFPDEFRQARKWWRGRLTLEKLMFFTAHR